MKELQNSINKADEEPQASPSMPMKTCPFCGGQILAIAKKCKYCGEWLDMRNLHQQEKDATKQETTHCNGLPPSANSGNYTSNAYIDYDRTVTFVPEIIVLSIFIGFMTGWWQAFALSLVILFALLHIRFFSKKFLRALLWVMWGIVVILLIWFRGAELLAYFILGD